MAVHAAHHAPPVSLMVTMARRPWLALEHAQSYPQFASPADARLPRSGVHHCIECMGLRTLYITARWQKEDDSEDNEGVRGIGVARET